MSKDTKRVSVDMEEPFHRRLKMVAVREGQTIRELCLSALKEAVQKREAELSDEEVDQWKVFQQRVKETRQQYGDPEVSGDSTDIIRNVRDQH